MEQESNEQEPNEATEIVGGKVETVEVSRHPEASIPETDLSLADIERRRSHPLRWALIILAVLCAIIAPYWFGRSLAVNNTDSIVAVLGGVSPQGIALVGWVAVVITYVGLAMAVVVSPSWPWLIVFVLGLACEQFIAGLSMLNLNFWYSHVRGLRQAGRSGECRESGHYGGGDRHRRIRPGVCWSAGDYPEDLAAERTDQKLGEFHSVLRD